jgi:hypothetical protein
MQRRRTRKSLAGSLLSDVGHSDRTETITCTVAEALAGVTIPHIGTGTITIYARYRRRRTVAPAVDSPTELPWSRPTYVGQRTLPIRIRGTDATSVDIVVAWPNVASASDIAEPHQCVLRPLYTVWLGVVLGENVDSAKAFAVSADTLDFKVAFESEERVTVRATLMQCFDGDRDAAALDASRDWADAYARVAVERHGVITPFEITDTYVDFALSFLKRVGVDTDGVLVGADMPQVKQREFARELRRAVEQAQRERKGAIATSRKWRRDGPKASGQDVQVEVHDLGPDTIGLPPPSLSEPSGPPTATIRLRMAGVVNRIAGLEPERRYRMRLRPLLYASADGDTYGSWSAPVTFATAAQLRVTLETVDEWSITVAWSRRSPLKVPLESMRAASEGKDVLAAGFGNGRDEYLAFVYRTLIRGTFEALLETPMMTEGRSVQSTPQSMRRSRVSLDDVSSIGAESDAAISVCEVLPSHTRRAVFAGLDPDTSYVIKVRQQACLSNDVMGLTPTQAAKLSGEEVDFEQMAWCANAILVHTAPLLALNVHLGREGVATMTIARKPRTRTAAQDARCSVDRDDVPLKAAEPPEDINVHILQLRLIDGLPDVDRIVSALQGAALPATPWIVGLDTRGHTEADPCPVPYLRGSTDGAQYWDARARAAAERGEHGVETDDTDYDDDHRALKPWHSAPPGSVATPIHTQAFVLPRIEAMTDRTKLVNLLPPASGPMQFRCIGLAPGSRYAVQFRYKTDEEQPMSRWSTWTHFTTRTALSLAAVRVREHSAEVAWRHEADASDDIASFEVEWCGRLLRENNNPVRSAAHQRWIASDGRGRLYSPAARSMVVHRDQKRCHVTGLLSGNVYAVCVRARLRDGTCGPTSKFVFVQTLPPVRLSPSAVLERSLLVRVQRDAPPRDYGLLVRDWFAMALLSDVHCMATVKEMDTEERTIFLRDAQVVPATLPTERFDLSVKDGTGGRGSDLGSAVSFPVGADHFVVRNLVPACTYTVAARTSRWEAGELTARDGEVLDIEAELAVIAEETSNWCRPCALTTVDPLTMLIVTAKERTCVVAVSRPPLFAAVALDPLLRDSAWSCSYRFFLMGPRGAPAAGDGAEDDGVVPLDITAGTSQTITVEGLSPCCVYSLCYTVVFNDATTGRIGGLSAAERVALAHGDMYQVLGSVYTVPHAPLPLRLYECSARHISWAWGHERDQSAELEELMSTVGQECAVTSASPALTVEKTAVLQSVLRDGHCDVVLVAAAARAGPPSPPVTLSTSMVLAAPVDIAHTVYSTTDVMYVIEAALTTIDARGVAVGPFLEVARTNRPFVRLELHREERLSTLEVCKQTLWRARAAVMLRPPQQRRASGVDLPLKSSAVRTVLESVTSYPVRGSPPAPLSTPRECRVFDVTGTTATVEWEWPNDVALHCQACIAIEVRRSAIGDWYVAQRVAYPQRSAVVTGLCIREQYRLRIRAQSTYGSSDAAPTLLFATGNTLQRVGAAHSAVGEPQSSLARDDTRPDDRFAFPVPRDYDMIQLPNPTPLHAECGRFLAAEATTITTTLQCTDQLPPLATLVAFADGCDVPQCAAPLKPKPPRRDALAERSVARRQAAFIGVPGPASAEAKRREPTPPALRPTSGKLGRF